MQRIILTGGPGAGKSSLLKALQQCNYSCSQEISRPLIMEELAAGSSCLPWADLSCFVQKALDRMIRAYLDIGVTQAVSANGPQIIFFDRGIPDLIAYLRAAGAPIPARLREALDKYPYAKEVFFLPPYRDIYVQDEAREQTFAEAETLGHYIKDTYHAAGYRVTELPLCSLEERVKLIQQWLQLKQQKQYTGMHNAAASLSLPAASPVKNKKS